MGTKQNKDMKKEGQKKHEIKPEEPLQPEQEGTTDETCSARLSELEEALATAREEHDVLEDKYLRLAAEYDNYRKRTLKEKSDLLLHGGEKTLSALLPVVDDLERARQHIDTSDSIEALKEGIALIQTKFEAYLKAQGVEPMDPVGKPFNMSEQQAVATVPATEEYAAGIVMDCTKRGYKLHDKVLRYADVVVAQ